jgi:hypothetical protein
MVDQRLADISRERQPVGLCALAMNRQLAGPPIDVIQRHGRDLARPQPEPREQHQDREITTAHTGSAIAAGEQPRDLLALKPARQRAQPPARDARDRGHQRHRHPARHMQKHQQ